LAIFVGRGKVSPRDKLAEMRDDMRRHHLCFAIPPS
jgi:hypothetical protein